MEGYSIDAQKEFLVSYAKAKEFTEYKFYIDGGFSGKNLERPAIVRLINDVKNHKIDCVIVFKLDRISRSQKDTLMSNWTAGANRENAVKVFPVPVGKSIEKILSSKECFSIFLLTS